jgi:GNAT superfamily N-acetyltransferase
MEGDTMIEILNDLINFTENDKELKDHINYLLLKTINYDTLGKYKILHVDNKNIRFYWYAGKFLSNRKVKKELGMPPWDENRKNWLLVLDEDECIALSSYYFNLNNKKGYLKSSYVIEKYRGKGIYTYLFKKRLKLLSENKNLKLITGTATEMSKPVYEKFNFENVIMKGKYYVFEKEIKNNEKN